MYTFNFITMALVFAAKAENKVQRQPTRGASKLKKKYRRQQFHYIIFFWPVCLTQYKILCCCVKFERNIFSLHESIVEDEESKAALLYPMPVMEIESCCGKGSPEKCGANTCLYG